MDRLQAKRVQLIDTLQRCEESDRDLTIGQIMTPSPMTIDSNATAFELVKKFHEKLTRHFLVVSSDGELVGVVSDRDVLRCFGVSENPSEDELQKVFVRQLMSTDLITIGPKATAIEAVRLMTGYGINCVPVVSSDQIGPVGILTSTDLYVLLESLLELRSPSPSSSEQPA